MTSWSSSGITCGLRTAPSYAGTDREISGLPGIPGQYVNVKSDRRAQGGLPGEVPCEHGPFPGSLPPNPACAFQRTGLSSDYAALATGVAWMWSWHPGQTMSVLRRILAMRAAHA